MLTINVDEYDQLVEQMEQTGTADGFNVLIAASFYEAARRRFGLEWTVADVIRFVAEVRVGIDDAAEDVDPQAAERLTMAVLGRGSAEDMDEEAKARAQIALLIGLVEDEDLDEAGLDGFLAEARKLADATTVRLEKAADDAG